ncbi:MAG: tetratricopeptide repeat protein [Candidatus Tritonobacter lacicola]|nr:tetratricopeptide repeat protein [Candidatus Tritonobacter lacicola]
MMKISIGKAAAALAIVFAAATIAAAQDARNLIIEGVNLGRQEKFDEAIASFRKALEIDPAYLAAHINTATAELLWAEKEDKAHYVEAVRALERASMLAPHDRQSSRWMSLNGRAIIPYMEERVSSSGDDARARYDLASAYMLAGETDKAIGEYETAVSLARDSAPIHSDLGRALIHAGRTDEAAAAMEKAVELDPELAGALVNLGNLRYREGKPDEALSLYLRAREADPGNALAYAQLGNLYLKLGKLEEAKRALNAALKLNRHLTNAYLDLADVYLRQKKFRAAIEQCEAALREKRKFPEAEIMLGELCYLDRNMPKARKHFRAYLQTWRQHRVEDEETLEKFKEHCKSRLETIRELQGYGKPKKKSVKLFKKAHRYYEAGDYDSAVDIINTILETDEKMGKTYTLLGTIFLRKEKPEPELAMSIFRGALQQHVILDKGSRILTLQGLAEACSRSGRPGEAEEALLELLSIQPDYIHAHYELARIYAEKGEEEKSLQKLSKGASLEKEKGRDTLLNILMEEPAFESMKDNAELLKLRDEFSR